MSTQQKQSQAQPFEKRAAIATTDAERQIAVGVAMVPDSVDTDGDFERPATIQRLSEGYMERLAANDADSGIMHAVFPGTNTISHVENRVLDDPEIIGDTEYPAGTWVVGKRVKDDAIWKLVQNGTLSGFSIGGYIHEKTEHIGSDIPDDVSVPDDMREASEGIGFPIVEITDADIHEISLVDTPAVPEAQIQTAKSGGGEGFLKAPAELTDGADVAAEFLSEERDHDETAARELAEVLNRDWKSATAASGGTADSHGWVARAKSFFSSRSGGSGGENTTPSTSKSHEMTDDETEKAGRVLSGENVGRAMALHDIAIDMLDGTDVRQNRLRFTDDVSTDFDVAEFESKATDESSGSPTGESGRDADANTYVWEVLESMNDNNEMDEFAELVAEKLRDDGDNDDDEQSGEKNADDAGEGDDGDQTATVDDLAETVEQLAENQATILERIENAEGASQQKASASANAGGETWGKSSPFAPVGAGAGGDE